MCRGSLLDGVMDGGWMAKGDSARVLWWLASLDTLDGMGWDCDLARERSEARPQCRSRSRFSAPLTHRRR